MTLPKLSNVMFWLCDQRDVPAAGSRVALSVDHRLAVRTPAGAPETTFASQCVHVSRWMLYDDGPDFTPNSSPASAGSSSQPCEHDALGFAGTTVREPSPFAKMCSSYFDGVPMLSVVVAVTLPKPR